MTGGERESSLDPARLRAIESLFEGLPESFEERHDELKKLRGEFYAHMAKSLEPALNSYVRSLPLDTQEERSDAASWINKTLRNLGLMLVSLRNEPAILVADAGGRARRSRFRFQSTDVSGRRVRSPGSDEMPDLELMQAPPRIENLARDFKEAFSSRNRKDDQRER